MNSFERRRCRRRSSPSGSGLSRNFRARDAFKIFQGKTSSSDGAVLRAYANWPSLTLHGEGKLGGSRVFFHLFNVISVAAKFPGVFFFFSLPSRRRRAVFPSRLPFIRIKWQQINWNESVNEQAQFPCLLLFNLTVYSSPPLHPLVFKHSPRSVRARTIWICRFRRVFSKLSAKLLARRFPSCFRAVNPLMEFNSITSTSVNSVRRGEFCVFKFCYQLTLFLNFFSFVRLFLTFIAERNKVHGRT